MGRFRTRVGQAIAFMVCEASLKQESRQTTQNDRLCHHFATIRMHGPLRSRALLAANPVPGNRRTRPGSALARARGRRRVRRAGQFSTPPAGPPPSRAGLPIYSRQILFPGIGERGQEALLHGHAAVAGCGALGSFHAAALARAGVGRLTLIDRDYVEPSTLHRQWLFEEADAAEALPKAAAAERHIARINSSIRARGVIADLTSANVAELLGDADVILDGTDNFETRYLINDFAVSRGIPWVYGAAVASYGITMPVIPSRPACLRCVYPDPPTGVQPTCETAGVLNAIVSAVASIQVADALRILTGAELRARITTLDLWKGGVRQIDAPAHRSGGCR